MTTKKDKEMEKDAEERVDEEVAEEPGPAVVGPELLSASAPEIEPEAGEADVHHPDDGVEDIELGPPAVGQWVQITGGDYAGRFAAYLGNVEMEADDDPTRPAVIQVRTRDADNLLLDVPYADVTATTYSGGR